MVDVCVVGAVEDVERVAPDVLGRTVVEGALLDDRTVPDGTAGPDGSDGPTVDEPDEVGEVEEVDAWDVPGPAFDVTTSDEPSIALSSPCEPQAAATAHTIATVSAVDVFGLRMSIPPNGASPLSSRMDPPRTVSREFRARQVRPARKQIGHGHGILVRCA